MSAQAFTTLGHPRRLAIFRLLMRRYPDALPAGEIAAILGLKASTLSVYLSALRDTGLIRQSRLGTSLRYSADVSQAGALVSFLFEDCCRGRGDLCLQASHVPSTQPDEARYRVLFICTGNSARSIMAETLLKSLAGDRFTAFSAGTSPRSELDPFAVRMLRDKGHDVSTLHSKHVAEFQRGDSPGFDFVFTVCDRAANEECPPWPGQPITGHWGLPDPVKATGTDAERRLAYQQVYGALRNRIRAFTALPLASLDRIALQAKVDDMARLKDET